MNTERIKNEVALIRWYIARDKRIIERIEKLIRKVNRDLEEIK